MARNAVVTCPAGTWTQLTNADASGDVTVILKSWNTPALLQATTTSSAPTATDGAPLLAYGDGWSESTIAEKFPEPENTSGTAVRLWARPLTNNPYNAANAGSVEIFISHA